MAAVPVGVLVVLISGAGWVVAFAGPNRLVLVSRLLSATRNTSDPVLVKSPLDAVAISATLACSVLNVGFSVEGNRDTFRRYG